MEGSGSALLWRRCCWKASLQADVELGCQAQVCCNKAIAGRLVHRQKVELCFGAAAGRASPRALIWLAAVRWRTAAERFWCSTIITASSAHPATWLAACMAHKWVDFGWLISGRCSCPKAARWWHLSAELFSPERNPPLTGSMGVQHCIAASDSVGMHGQRA